MSLEKALKTLRENSDSTTDLISKLENKINGLEMNIEYFSTEIEGYLKRIEEDKTKLLENKAILEALKTIVNE